MLNIPEDEPVKRGFFRCPSPLLGATQNFGNLNISPRPRKRASSFKKPKEKNYDLLSEEIRPRTSSMPTRNSFKKPFLQHTHLGLNIEPDIETYMVRSFHMNSKGEIVYRSDSIRSRSANSVFSSDGDFCPLSPSSRTSSSISRDSAGTVSPASGAQIMPFSARVLVLGAPGVGKTALTEQFLTSEYLGGFDTSIGKYSYQLDFKKVEIQVIVVFSSYKINIHIFLYKNLGRYSPNHSQEHSLSFSPRFSNCNVT